MEGADVVDALLELAVDREPEVSSAALSSLMRKTLDDEDWNVLEGAIVKMPRESHSSLVNGLVRRNDDGPRPPRLLAAMLASESVGEDVKQRIASILATK